MCDISDKLNNMAILLKEDKFIIKDYIVKIYKELFQKSNCNIIKVEICRILVYPDSIIKRLIRYAIKDLNGNLKGISYQHINDILDIMKSQKTGNKKFLPGKIVFEIF